MKKILIAILLFPLTIQAQLTMRDVFLQMPDSLLPYLSQSNRLDLLDYFDAKMKPEVTNELDGRTCFISMSSDSLVLRMNDNHDVTIFLLEALEEIDSTSQVIALVRKYRLSTGEQETVMQFYNHQWSLLSEPPRLSTQQMSILPPNSSSLIRRDEEVMSKSPVIVN